MKFIFSMPFWTCPPNPAFVSQDAVIAFSVAAEEAGFAGVSFTEHPIPDESWRQSGGHDDVDPFVGLSFAAGATKRIRLLTYLCVAPYRNPFLLAKSAASLDALSGGRLILGLGAGYQMSEYAALGVDFDERNALFDEALEVLPLAWSGEPVNYNGRHFSARNVTAWPRPSQRPHPPLWIGGNSRATIRRVAEHGQGWLAMPSTPQQADARRSVAMVGLPGLQAKLAELRAHAQSIGRTEPIAIHVPLPHRAEAQSNAEHKILAGELSELGVTWCNWATHAATVSEVLDEIRRFGDEVIGELGST